MPKILRGFNYEKFKNGIIRRIEDGAHIPPDPANSDYAEYLEWAKTNTAPDATEPSTAPDPAREARKQATATKLKAALGVTDLKGLQELIQDGFNA